MAYIIILYKDIMTRAYYLGTCLNKRFSNTRKFSTFYGKKIYSLNC